MTVWRWWLVVGVCLALAACGSDSGGGDGSGDSGSGEECTASEGSVASPVSLATDHNASHTVAGGGCAYFSVNLSGEPSGYRVTLDNTGTGDLRLRVYDNADYESPDDCGVTVPSSSSDLCLLESDVVEYIKIENDSEDSQTYDLIVQLSLS